MSFGQFWEGTLLKVFPKIHIIKNSSPKPIIQNKNQFQKDSSDFTKVVKGLGIMCWPYNKMSYQIGLFSSICLQIDMNLKLQFFIKHA